MGQFGPICLKILFRGFLGPWAYHHIEMQTTTLIEKEIGNLLRLENIDWFAVSVLSADSGITMSVDNLPIQPLPSTDCVSGTKK